MRGWLLAIALALTSQAALAAEPAAPAPSGIPAPAPETLDLARQLITASGAGDNFTTRMRALMDPIMNSMAGNLPAGQQAEREAAMALAQEQVAADAPLLLDAAAKAYATTFSADELRQLLAFYQTPIGRSLVAKQGVLATQMGQETAKLGPKLMQDILVRLCSKMTCPPAMRKQLEAMTGI